ncbi:MAG: SH3 domain-containing protein [Litorilinea sp.]
MKDQESNENWELEEGNQVDDRWVLRESEQQLAGQWELNQAAEDEPIRDWQPVEYNRPERSGFAWILPVLITVFLLALIGYSGFILLPQIINPADPDPIAVISDNETPPPEEEAVVGEDATPDPAVIAEDDPPATDTTPGEDTPLVATPVPELAATAAPADPPAENTDAPAIVEQDFATVITTYGVNARSQPDADAEIVRILNQGESFFLFGSPAEGWLELLVTDENTELVPGEPIAGQIAYAASEFFDVDEQPIAGDLYNDILAFAGRTPPEPVVTSEDEGAAEDTPAEDDDDSTIGLPTATPGPAADNAAEPEPVTVQVDSAAGLNVRTTPDTTGEVVALLPVGAIVPGLAISDDELWVQVELEDGATGWLFSEFVTISGDVTTIDGTPPPAAAAPVVIDTTEVLTSGIVPPAPFTAIIPGDSPAIVVAVIAGAIARVEPNATAQELTLLPQGAALPALSRTSNGQWIQIELPDGNLTGWVSRSVVSVTNDIDTLPSDDVPLPDAETTDEDTTDEDADSPILLLPTPTPPADSDAEAEDGTAGDDTAGDSVEATVRDILLTVYPEPNSTGNSVALLPRGTAVPVTGRNSDGDWVLIETEEGDTGWVDVRSILLTVEVETLPVVEP